jgi:hypothetical protein
VTSIFNVRPALSISLIGGPQLPRKKKKISAEAKNLRDTSYKKPLAHSDTPAIAFFLFEIYGLIFFFFFFLSVNNWQHAGTSVYAI